MADASLVIEPRIEAPQLTVLLPSWNAASTIVRSIASILESARVPMEVVVIDDGSTDETQDLVRAIAERDPRVGLIRLAANGGVSNARNRGLASARGAWIAFHDADDRMLPGGIDALMGPTANPEVRAVIGQRIWSDGERTWLSPLYDIPDIREPGRKSIATNPGLLYYASATGKAFHRSLLDGLEFEGRVLGDQAWTIRALLRAGTGIEVIEQTVFEWSRPHPDRFVETITSKARASAVGGAEMAAMARTVYAAVSDETDRVIEDPAIRARIKRVYLERLIRSDLGGPVRAALDRRDHATARLLDGLATFLGTVPEDVIRDTGPVFTSLVQPPATRWGSVPRSARAAYWALVRQSLRGRPRIWHAPKVDRSTVLAFTLARHGGAVGARAASVVMSLRLRRRRGT